MSTTFSSHTRHGTWRSPAKVNLCLRIVGRRDDGYHLLDSIFVPIDLYDRITVAIDRVCGHGDVAVTIHCSDRRVPTDGSNLVARAAAMLLTEAQLGASITVDIEKHIPPGSGLGGGSGNAATMLLGLDRLLDLRSGSSRLAELALRLGADVPFFLSGRPARVRGIGEDVQPIPGWPETAMVVAVPRLSVSTPWAFRRFRETVPLDGVAAGESEAARMAAGAPASPDLLVNDLEQVVLPAFPAVAALKERLRRAGATAAVMSGSGSAVVALAPSELLARDIAARVGREDPEVEVHAVNVIRSGPEAGVAPAATGSP